MKDHLDAGAQDGIDIGDLDIHMNGRAFSPKLGMAAYLDEDK